MPGRAAAAVRGARLPDVLTAIVVAVLAVVVTVNAFHYATVSGFDAEVDLRYAHILLTEWRIPDELANNYTPPLFFLVAGPLVELGGPLGLADTGDLAQLLVGAMTVGTAVLVALLCGILFPGRPWLRLAAVGFFAANPTVLKLGAMFHPQPLVTLLATAAVALTAWMVAHHRYGVWHAVVLGLLLGAGQLVRSVGIWALGVVCVALLVAVVVDAPHRWVALRALVVAAALGVAVALPWYLVLEPQNAKPVFPGSADAPVRTLASAQAPERTTSRSVWFYVDPGLPDVITAPHREALAPRFWPIVYADMWGDYYGNWAWNAELHPLTPSIERRLRDQSIAGLVPTFLAAAGLVALGLLALLRVRARPELIGVPLTVSTALLAALYYAYSYPSPDADTVKALFLLPGLPALAVCFGFLLETVGRRSRPVGIGLASVCCVALLASFAFGIA